MEVNAQGRMLTGTAPAASPLSFLTLHPTPLQVGTVLVHTIRRGHFVAALQPPGASLPGPVSHLVLGSEGQIVVQSSARERLGAQVWDMKRDHPPHMTV